MRTSPASIVTSTAPGTPVITHDRQNGPTSHKQPQIACGFTVHVPTLANWLAVEPGVVFLGVEEGLGMALVIVLKRILDVAFCGNQAVILKVRASVSISEAQHSACWQGNWRQERAYDDCRVAAVLRAVIESDHNVDRATEEGA